MSGEVEASQADLDLKALENFLVGNQDLERLEALLDRFNILEALGVVRQELRHSDFLRFLLDPRNPHGLGDTFVKRLLQRVLMVAGDVPVPLTPIELELWDLGRVEVRKEWQHIDILLVDEVHQLVVIVENKIGTREHSDQLRRYYRIVEEHHPGWRIVAVYLTPNGDLPSHGSYLPVDYGLVCEVMDGLAEDRASVVNPDLKTLMAHYTDMMRRHILADSDVARLSRQIYQKHKRALDLIYEHRPDPRGAIYDLLMQLISNTKSVIYKGKYQRTYLYFCPEEWDGPNPDHDLLLFVFHNHPGELSLFLEVVGWRDERLRRRLFETARRDGSPFNNLLENPRKGLNPKLYRRTLLTSDSYEEDTEGDREEKIRKQWAEFLEKDLPRIVAALKEEKWIWEAADPNDLT